MRNPKTVFTESGEEDHRAHLRNLEKALFHLRNNDDDLHISFSDEGEEIMQAVYKLDELLHKHKKFLREGDGETDDD